MKFLKRRVLILLGAGVATMLLTFALFVYLSQPLPELTQARFDEIMLGSTRIQIEEFLGRPRQQISKRAIVWVPRNERIVSAIVSSSTNIRFFPEADMDGYELLWMDESGLIAGHFGEDDCLKNKYHSTVTDCGGPSFVDWIVSRKKYVP